MYNDWYGLQNTFKVTNSSGTALMYTNSDRTSEPVTADPNEKYTVFKCQLPDFNNVSIIDSKGNVYYADYSAFTPEKESDDTTFVKECWDKTARYESEMGDIRDQQYQNQYGSNTFQALIDDEGDAVVGPLKDGSQIGTDIYMSAIVKTYGMPPQWTKYVDPRTYAFELQFKNSGVPNTKCALGRRFIDVTIARPTIMEIAPGRVYYPDEGLGTKENYRDMIDNYTTASDSGSLSDLVNDDKASFFTIKPCYTDSPDGKVHGYISYVSVLMKVFAAFLSRNNSGRRDNVTHYYNKSALNLGDFNTRSLIQFSERTVPVFNVKYIEFTWHQYDGEGDYKTDLITTGFVKTLFYGSDEEKTTLEDTYGSQHGVLIHNTGTTTEDYFTYIRFFGLNGTRSSDTFDTQIDDTQVAGLVNGVSNGVRDAAFFISGVIGDKFGKDLDDAAATLKEAANDGKGGMLSALLDSTVEVVRGGKVVFPKIISDCDYGKSMSVECVFTSVYGDPESVYLNSYAGLAHILAFALPHQVKSSIEIYTYPFLVKAFCKGVFNCSMGVLSGISIDYAGESGDMWSVDSVPTEIKVSFQITPLISKLVMTSENDSAGWLLRNNGLQEYIATIAGSDLRSDKVALATELAGIMFQDALVKMEAGALQKVLDYFQTSSVGAFIRNVQEFWNNGGTVSKMFDNLNFL